MGDYSLSPGSGLIDRGQVIPGINDDEVAWNITPDEATLIGPGTEEEIATCLRTGELSYAI